MFGFSYYYEGVRLVPLEHYWTLSSVRLLDKFFRTIALVFQVGYCRNPALIWDKLLEY